MGASSAQPAPISSSWARHESICAPPRGLVPCDLHSKRVLHELCAKLSDPTGRRPFNEHRLQFETRQVLGGWVSTVCIPIKALAVQGDVCRTKKQAERSSAQAALEHPSLVVSARGRNAVMARRDSEKVT